MKHEDMDLEDSEDFICYNNSFYYGKYYPIVYYELEDDCENVKFTKIEDLPIRNTNQK